ncbi:DUF3158 family protein [Pseudomonas gingeri]|uniref:DUF3158 family protein n=1 Tax=Pseudomonas gingeri TaxID=117681 RepID=A0A7Y8C5M6_9PSED|nr:DUF3158 family protein [Pseudomonas gingeri]NWB99556.1 DUF3158 family protein [Pseudomonas gingeri]
MTFSRNGFADEQPTLPGVEAKHDAFRPLQHTAFCAVKHAAFFKGLLKPFKGKGELLQFGEACSELTGSLIELAIEGVLAQAEQYPFTLLPIRLTRQSTGAGTVFLRWCRVDRSKMGVDLWAELIGDMRTSINLLPDLYALELQRIVINMQISLAHSLSRQAYLCAGKVEVADQVYRQRMEQHIRHHREEN